MKNPIFRKGSWKTNIEGGFPKKKKGGGGLGQFPDLREDLEKRWGWCFWVGGWYPNAHYEVKNNYYAQILKFSLWKSKNIFNDFLKDVV